MCCEGHLHWPYSSGIQAHVEGKTDNRKINIFQITSSIYSAKEFSYDKDVP